MYIFADDTAVYLAVTNMQDSQILQSDLESLQHWERTWDVPLPSARIKDGMSLVNKISGNNSTFGDIAERIFMIAIQSGNASSRIDIVFDVNKDNSIKTRERKGRGEATGLAHISIIAGQKIQQWRRLLRS